MKLSTTSQRWVKSTAIMALIISSILLFQNCAEQNGFYAKTYQATSFSSAAVPTTLSTSNTTSSSNTNNNNNYNNNSTNNTFPNSNQTSPNNSTPKTPSAVPKTNIQYFGYFGNPVSGDYIDEVIDHTNFVITDPTQYSSANFRNLLTKAKNKQMKLIISVSNIFYKLEGLNLTFRTNLWDQVAADISAANALDVILSFYFDEPELAVDAIKEMARQQNTTVQLDYLTEMNRIAATVKGRFPSAKMQMTSAYVHVNPSMVLPSSFDYFGFDCYSGWEACGDANHSSSIPQYFQTLKQKVMALNSQDGKARRIFLIPPTFADAANSTAIPYGPPTVSLVLNIFPKYMELALSDSIVIGIMPFLWQDLQENSKLFWGARSYPAINSMVRSYGKQILNR